MRLSFELILSLLLTSLGDVEVAAGLKAQANELFAQKKYRDAIGFYTRAIDEVGKDLEVEERREIGRAHV